MKVEITPTQDPEKLVENLEKRVKEIQKNGEKLVTETEEDPEIFSRTPGIEKFETPEEEEEGLKGRPVQEPAYARLESKRDLARAVVATIDGYDLRILNTGNQWDLKILRRFNPDIKHLKQDEPVEMLDIEKTLDEEDSDLEKVEIDLSEEEVEMISRFAQPGSED